MTITPQPAYIKLTAQVSVPNWTPPHDQRAVRELAEGLEAAAAEADRLTALIPEAFRPGNVEITPSAGSTRGPGWTVTVYGREPYTDEEPE